MTIEEYIKLAKKKSATPEAIKEFEIRCAERGKRFAEEARKRRPTKECMDRQYTI